MKREFLQSLKVGDQPLPKDIVDAIMEENGRDIQAGKVWQEKYAQAQQQHEKALKDVTFGAFLDGAILRAGGRNAKAITALLDVDTLKESQNQNDAIEQALAALKKDCGYLFHETQTPPPYARGTGAAHAPQTDRATTLAGALRERYEGK